MLCHWAKPIPLACLLTTSFLLQAGAQTLPAWAEELPAGSARKPIVAFPSLKYASDEPANPEPVKVAPFVLAKGMVREDTRVVINIPSRTLWVYNNDQLVRYFPVGVGRVGFITPIGKFRIMRKVESPGWENPYQAKGKVRIPPGDENPLGSRWMGFYENRMGEFGMHGTDNPASVGKFSSHGCVRMKIPDAEVLFDMVDIGTPVEVIYEPVLIRRQGNTIRVIVYKDLFHRGMPTLAKVKADILKQYPKAEIDDGKLTEALKLPTERAVDVANTTEAGKTR